MPILTGSSYISEKVLQKSTVAVKNVQHVLVDEFQDTNSIQYNIVRLMAKSSQSLTIVGDPDQSIYSWRSAEVENLHHMLKGQPLLFPCCHILHLLME